MTKLLEPRIHSYITDELPEEHPLAHKATYCIHCAAMLHASNNECMLTWVETGKGNHCLDCFVQMDRLTEMTDEYGLKS